MEEQNQDAQAQSSGALEAAIASSPEAQEQIEQNAQGTETPTPQEGESQQQEVQEENRVPYSRLKEVVDEKNWYKQQMETMLQRQQPPQQFQQPATDPYAGMTAEEEKFWRAVDARAERVAQQKLSQISPVIDAGRMELAQMKVQQFRTQHPDIRPNSPEEVAIAEKIQMGYLPEDAYRSVMWDNKVVEAEKKANNNVKQKMEVKKQANVEHRSIPAGAIPGQKQDFSAKSLRSRIEQAAQDLGL